MGLRQRLAAQAVRGARVLLVEAPGYWQVRANVERAVLQRGWSLALSPADADALVVCGRPGEKLAAAVDLVWQQLPGPRARQDIADADLLSALDRIEAALLDLDGQRADARGRQQQPDTSGGGGHDDMEMSDGDDMDMDMDMDMASDGVDLAGGFDGDRDGLEMDVLHVSLGPVLPGWPAGLVLRATLSGDVLVDAGLEVLDTALPAPRDPARAAQARPSEPSAMTATAATAARGCDHAATLLGLAGADDLAAALRCVRDDLLSGTSPDQVGPKLERLTRRVTRSRVLRWSLHGLGRLDAAALDSHGLPAGCGGDVHDRLIATLQGAVAALRGPGDSDSHAAATPGRGRQGLDDAGLAERVRDAVPALVTGCELAAARLVIASLPLDPLTDPATAAVR